MLQRWFEEKKECVFDKGVWLAEWIDEYSEDTKEYCDMNFAYIIFDLDGKLAKEALHGGYLPVPYWLEGLIGNVGIEHDWLCEYVPHSWDAMKIGDAVAASLSGEEKKEYEYINRELLPEEMEHQAEDGICVYEYRGPSFMRIFKPVDLS